MKLYASDGCTYSAEFWLGVFDSRPAADQCVLEDLELSESGKDWRITGRKIEDYEVKEFELNQKLD